MAPLPRRRARWTRPTLFALLLAAALLLSGLGGWLLWVGEQALAPGSIPIGGTVQRAGGAPIPIPGAWVKVQGENGFVVNTTVASGGTFRVPGVPYGGIELDAGAPGYSEFHESLFVSPVYTSVSGDLTSLILSLTPSGRSNATALITSLFPDLESLVADLWSGTAILGIAAVVTGVAAVTVRAGRWPLAVAAGAAVAASPVVLPILGIDFLGPTIFAVALAALPVGAGVLLLALPGLGRSVPPIEPL